MRDMQGNMQRWGSKNKMKLTIDNHLTEAEEGKTILEVTKNLGIYIPTLCYHEALTPQGSCRLCVVEIEVQNKKKIVTSCDYKIQENMNIYTSTEKIKKLRQMGAKALLARCPESKKIQSLAYELGVEEPQEGLKRTSEDNCVLCGLCVRACKEIVGVEATSFANRGLEKKVTTPFDAPSDACIGCGMCAYLCPTQNIRIEEKNGKRIIQPWGKEVEMLKCEKCETPFMPKDEAEHIKKELGISADYFNKCPKCAK